MTGHQRLAEDGDETDDIQPPARSVIATNGEPVHLSCGRKACVLNLLGWRVKGSG